MLALVHHDQVVMLLTCHVSKKHLISDTLYSCLFLFLRIMTSVCCYTDTLDITTCMTISGSSVKAFHPDCIGKWLQTSAVDRDIVEIHVVSVAQIADMLSATDLYSWQSTAWCCRTVLQHKGQSPAVEWSSVHGSVFFGPSNHNAMYCMQSLDEYFGTDTPLNEDDKFLRHYVLNKV